MLVGKVHVTSPVIFRQVVLAGPKVIPDKARMQWLLSFREGVRPHALQAEQSVDWSGMNARQEFAFRISPPVLRGAGHVDRPGRHQGNELVLIDG